MPYEKITLDQFSELWIHARDNINQEDLGGGVMAHHLETFEGDKVLIVMNYESGILIRL